MPDVVDVVVRFFMVLLLIMLTYPLTLTLMGYNFWQNKKTTISLCLIITILLTFTFYLPQTLRLVVNLLGWFGGFKWYLHFSTSRSFVATFIFLVTGIFVVDVLVWIIFLHGFHVSPAEAYSSHALQLIYPWVLAPLYVLLIYISYRRGWQIPYEFRHFGLKAGLVALPSIQSVLLMVIIIEDVGNPSFRMEAGNPEALVYVLVALALAISFYSLWEILRYAGREALVQAQEEAARDMQERVNAVRAQRHDFINHIQILTALLHEKRLQEMRQYVDNVMREIGLPG